MRPDCRLAANCSMLFTELDVLDRPAVAKAAGPAHIRPALAAARELMTTYRVPAVVEVILERITDVAMGTSIDNVVEFDEQADSDGSQSRSPEESFV
jgi:glyoxylate carboligase